jgi:hypothetical protein
VLLGQGKKVAEVVKSLDVSEVKLRDERDYQDFRVRTGSSTRA